PCILPPEAAGSAVPVSWRSGGCSRRVSGTTWLCVSIFILSARGELISWYTLRIMNVNAMVQKQGWLPLKTSRQFAYLAVLLNGACVLIVEIAGARLLAPYFGTALFIWTSAISVVLGALAFGYFLGSKLAVREALAPLIAK